MGVEERIMKEWEKIQAERGYRDTYFLVLYIERMNAESKIDLGEIRNNAIIRDKNSVWGKTLKHLILEVQRRELEKPLKTAQTARSFVRKIIKTEKEVADDLMIAEEKLSLVVLRYKAEFAKNSLLQLNEETNPEHARELIKDIKRMAKAGAVSWNDEKTSLEKLVEVELDLWQSKIKNVFSGLKNKLADSSDKSANEDVAFIEKAVRFKMTRWKDLEKINKETVREIEEYSYRR